MNSVFSFLPRLWSNWITLLGAILTTCSALAIVLVFTVGLFASGANPYAGAILVLVLPFLFIAGLIIIPIGFHIDHRARAKTGVAVELNPAQHAFRTALGKGAARPLIVFFAIATAVNVLVFSIGGQAAVQHMDSAQFCGTTCHTAMEPEWTAYADSQHSHVACVECHIGSGTKWEVKAKLNGLNQLWGVVSGHYHRPVPVPVEQLRPSRDTCEQCHSQAKFTGNKVVVLPHFKPDQSNTPVYNILAVHVGGRDEQSGKYQGIHWHAGHQTEVVYEQLDEARNKVGKIRVYDLTGERKLVSEYLPPERDRSLPVLSVRSMDCIDCHDRPTHVFDASATAAVDRVMGRGGLDPKLPWLAAAATAALEAKDVQAPASAARFRTALDETYRTLHPEVKMTPEMLDPAAKTLAALYHRNVFPKMNVGWGTYRNRLGHKHEGEKVAEIGCFRCHDGEHVKTGPGGAPQTLSQSCELCHEQIVAGDDPATLEADLKQLLPR